MASEPDYRHESFAVTFYCRWCHEPFEKLKPCHRHQDECSLRGVYPLDSYRARRDLEAAWPSPPFDLTGRSKP